MRRFVEPEAQDFPNDPFDDELSFATVTAAQLVECAKNAGLAELELPIADESAVWVVTVKRLRLALTADIVFC